MTTTEGTDDPPWSLPTAPTPRTDPETLVERLPPPAPTSWPHDQSALPPRSPLSWPSAEPPPPASPSPESLGWPTASIPDAPAAPPVPAATPAATDAWRSWEPPAPDEPPPPPAAPSPPPPPSPPAATGQPRRPGGYSGGLDIRDRRQWRTWQLVTAVLLTLLVGMAIGHTGADTGSAGHKATFVLPPSATTSAGSGAETSTSSGGATGSVPSGNVILPRMQSTGPGSTGSFSVNTPGWTINWIFDCSATPTGSAPFQIFIVPGGGSIPVVDEAARTASGSTTQTSTGAESLRIGTDQGCAWAVTVTVP